MLKRIALGALLLCAGFSAGCGAARPSNYYQLTPASSGATTAASSPYPVTLLIGRLTASHLYREDRIVYSSGSEQMGAYESQRWAEPPTEMLEEAMLRELRASGRYRSVGSLTSNARGDFLLRGHLVDFKEISGKSLLARVSFELEVRETKTGLTVWTHSYSHDEPVNGKEISAVVAALNQNVQRGVSEVAASLDQYFSTHPPN